MSGRRRDLPGTSSGAPEGLTHNPFASLRAGGTPTSRIVSAPTAAPSARTSSDASASPRRIVVRVERKGHGGKTVTRVEGLVGRDLAELARELSRALGAGARVEGADLVVQGEHVERIERCLVERGVRDVVRGNR